LDQQKYQSLLTANDIFSFLCRGWTLALNTTLAEEIAELALA
jgi:hypothetical protein